MKKMTKRTAIVCILIILYAAIAVTGIVSNYVYWRHSFDYKAGAAICFAITGVLLLIIRGKIISKCKQKVEYQNVQLDDKVTAEADDAAKANEFVRKLYSRAIIAVALSMFILGFGIITLQAWLWSPYSGSIGVVLGSIGIIIGLISIVTARRGQKHNSLSMTMVKTVIWLSVIIIIGTILIALCLFMYFMDPAHN